MIAEELYLQDIGTEAYTEYDYGEDYITLMMNNPKLQDCKVAHAHSHHNMATFFSGTDLSEIYDNSEFHNYYLSLIVNNRGDMCAKVAFRETIESHITSYITSRDKNGNLKQIRVDNNTESSFKVMCYDCEIFRDIIEDNILQERIDILKKKKEEKKKFIQKSYIPPAQPKAGNPNLGYSRNPIQSKQMNVFDDSWDDIKYRPIIDQNSIVPSKIDDIVERQKVEKFLITWLNQDYLAIIELNRTINSLNAQVNSKNFHLYLEKLEETIDDYYMNIFYEDLHLVLFEKVMNQAIEILKCYVKQYEKLIIGLIVLIEEGTSDENAFAITEQNEELLNFKL